MQVFPIFQAFFIGFGTIGGMIFYEQTWVLQEEEGKVPGWVVYSISASGMVAGCFALMVHGKTEFTIKDAISREEEKVKEEDHGSEVNGTAPSALNQSVTWMRRATVQDIVKMRGPGFLKKNRKDRIVPQKMTYEELKQKVEPDSPVIQAASKFLSSDEISTPPPLKSQASQDLIKMKNDLLEAYKVEYKEVKEETKRRMKIELLNLQKESKLKEKRGDVAE